jgi:hypothetical protein
VTPSGAHGTLEQRHGLNQLAGLRETSHLAHVDVGKRVGGPEELVECF